MLDLLLWIFGDAASVTAHLSNGTNRYGCDEWGEGMIRFTSGTVATFAAGWNDISDPTEMEICGTAGHAIIFGGQLYVEGAAFGDAKITVPYPGEIGDSLPSGLDAFLHTLTTGERGAGLVTVGEAAYRNVVMEALYKAAAAERWVSVEPIVGK